MRTFVYFVTDFFRSIVARRKENTFKKRKETNRLKQKRENRLKQKRENRLKQKRRSATEVIEPYFIE